VQIAGDGFTTDAAIMQQHGLTDPRPFFNELRVRSYVQRVVLAPQLHIPGQRDSSAPLSTSDSTSSSGSTALTAAAAAAAAGSNSTASWSALTTHGFCVDSNAEQQQQQQQQDCVRFAVVAGVLCWQQCAGQHLRAMSCCCLSLPPVVVYVVPPAAPTHERAGVCHLPPPLPGLVPVICLYPPPWLGACHLPIPLAECVTSGQSNADAPAVVVEQVNVTVDGVAGVTGNTSLAGWIWCSHNTNNSSGARRSGVCQGTVTAALVEKRRLLQPAHNNHRDCALQHTL
jgi:hypothetical protein